MADKVLLIAAYYHIIIVTQELLLDHQTSRYRDIFCPHTPKIRIFM